MSMRRMIFAISALSLVAIVASGLHFKSGIATTLAFERAGYSVATNHTATTRVYLFPGIPGDNTQWSIAPHTWLRDRLISEGYEVVSVAGQTARPKNFLHPLMYRWAFGRYLDATVASVDAKYGGKDRVIVGGISYGGLHALMAAELRPEYFQEWFASMPVTKIAALTQYSFLGEVSAFDPTVNPSLLRGRGLLLWGTADMTVNFQFTKNMFARLNATRVTGLEYANAAHETTARQLDDIASWVARADASK